MIPHQYEAGHLLADSGTMNMDLEAPCEACGGLLPLKAIQTRRRGRHRQSCSIHPKQTKPGQLKEKIRGKSSHRRQPEQRSTSQSKETRKSRRSRQLSSNSDAQAEVTSNRNRLNYELGEQFQAAKPAVLEQFQAAFVNQKAKKQVIRCAIHGDQEHTERKSNSPIQQAQSQARQHPVCQHAPVVKRKQKKTLSPGDLDLPCHLHQHEGNSHNESVCTRVLGHLPHEDASNFSSNPSVSTSHKVRHVATQMSCKHLLAVSKQTRRRNVQTAAISSQSSSESTKTYNRGHVAPHECQHHEECRSRAKSPPEPYPEVICLYEECHLRHVEEHITTSQRSSSRDSRVLQRRGDHPEQGPQILFTCHQRVSHQSVVRHHEVTSSSPVSRDLTKLCERCSLPEPARNEFSPQETDESCKLNHHSSKACVKIEKLCSQMITPRSAVILLCKMHGDCGSEKVETCGTCWRPKADHINERIKTPDLKSLKKGKIHGCHLHREPPASLNRQDPKPKLCTSVRWLDKIIASQSIPPQIIREFLQGRREWPPEPMKQKCLGCMKKQTDDNESPREPSPCEFDVASWNPGSLVAQSTAECAKEHHDEKLARLFMARTQIIKPVVKLSTSKEVWRSRKELQCCSECWNPTKFGRWASILDEMSKDESEEAGMSNCDRKFSSCTAHGNPNPCDTGDVHLHCPQLFSTFSLRLKAQQLRNETFDRNTALQVEQKKCIKLDKKVLAQVPEKNSPPRVDRAKQESPSLRRCHKAISQKRQEPYVGLSKIVQPPNPICRVERPPREVGCQSKGPKLMPKPPQTIWICPDKIHPPIHSPKQLAQVQATQIVMPRTISPIYQVKQEHWLEQQHWTQMVEACKQSRNVVAVCDSRLHDLR